MASFLLHGHRQRNVINDDQHNNDRRQNDHDHNDQLQPESVPPQKMEDNVLNNSVDIQCYSNREQHQLFYQLRKSKQLQKPLEQKCCVVQFSFLEVHLERKGINFIYIC